MKGRFGNAVSLPTLDRWCGPGVGGVVLETIRIGGTVFTSEEATLRFIARLSESKSTPRTQTTPSRHQAIAAADRRLDQAGV